MFFWDQGQKGGIGSPSHVAFCHPRNEPHQVFLDQGPEDSIKANGEAVWTWGLVRVEAPYGFLNLVFRYGGFKPKPILLTDKRRDIRNHFLHDMNRDWLLISIQMLKKRSYLIVDGRLSLNESVVFSFKFPHGVPSLPFFALILKVFCILVSSF